MQHVQAINLKKKPQWIRSFTSANDVSKQTYFALEQQMGRRMNGWLAWLGLYEVEPMVQVNLTVGWSVWFDNARQNIVNNATINSRRIQLK